MILIKTAQELTKHLKNIRETMPALGFVPTMGALHNGHIELITFSRQQSNYCVASIFVNPTQFNDPKDFEKYPVTIENDIRQLEQAGCDVLFLPAVKEIYPGGTADLPHFELGYLETIWEGYYRPGHFQGVCQVMDRLLSIVMPDKLFMGRKDYQQCMVIKRLIEINGWNMEMVMVPTVREPSGLAMSSRNMRLTEPDRQKATAIYLSLQYIKKQLQPGGIEYLTRDAEKMLAEVGFDKIDYAAIADADTLQPITNWDGKTALVGLVAAFIGGVRLIDNMEL